MIYICALLLQIGAGGRAAITVKLVEVTNVTSKHCLHTQTDSYYYEHF
jgi:hypothetical protein